MVGRRCAVAAGLPVPQRGSTSVVLDALVAPWGCRTRAFFDVALCESGSMGVVLVALCSVEVSERPPARQAITREPQSALAYDLPPEYLAAASRCSVRHYSPRDIELKVRHAVASSHEVSKHREGAGRRDEGARGRDR